MILISIFDYNSFNFQCQSKKIIKTLQSIMVDTLPFVPNFIQYAGVEALKNEENLVVEILDKYKKCS